MHANLRKAGEDEDFDGRGAGGGGVQSWGSSGRGEHRHKGPSIRQMRKPNLSEHVNQPLVDLSWQSWLLPVVDWLRDAATFHPWAVVSSPQHPLGGPLNPTAFGFLPIASPFRKPFVRVARWKGLEYIMILVILANCVTLAMQSNQPGFEESELGQQLQIANYFFISTFVLEMIIKVIALGFAFGEHTYLRNGWNILDFIVVIFGFLEFVPGVGNYTVIRCARVLRPLRMVTKIEALRVIVVCLIRSLPMLADVAILAMFYYSIFGIACVELFRGQMSFRCGSPVSYGNLSVNGIYMASPIEEGRLENGSALDPQTL